MRYRVTVERTHVEGKGRMTLSEAVVAVNIAGQKYLSASESMDAIGNDQVVHGWGVRKHR